MFFKSNYDLVKSERCPNCHSSRLSNIVIVIIDVVYYSNSLSITIIIYCKKFALTSNFEGTIFNHHTTMTPL